jgi:AcrR family transcriptional regulator
LKQRASEAIRERVLRTGIKLFAGSGVAAINSNQIARAAGIGVGTFYAHYRDKQALLQAIVLRGLDELGRRAASAEPGPEAPPEARVRPLVEAAVSFAAEEPELFRVAFGPDAERVGLGASPRGTERALRGLQESGALPREIDPAVAARAFLAAQSGVLLWWLDAPAPPPREVVIETLVRLHPALALRRR